MSDETEDPSPSRPAKAPNRRTDRPKAKNGRFVASLTTAQKDAEAARLRSRGLTYRAVGEAMGEPEETAYSRVERALAAVRIAPALDLVKIELEKLDRLERAALKVLEAFHYVVSEGRVVTYQGPRQTKPQPLQDDGPALAAVKVLNELSKTRQDLLGLKAAKKLDVSGGVAYRFENVSADDL